MPFEEPIVSDIAEYTAMFQTDLTEINETARIEIKMSAGDEGWTPLGLDGVFQELLDRIQASPMFSFNYANKGQQVNTVVSPTPPEEPAPEG